MSRVRALISLSGSDNKVDLEQSFREIFVLELNVKVHANGEGRAERNGNMHFFSHFIAVVLF